MVCNLVAAVCGLGGVIGAVRLPGYRMEFVVGGVLTVLLWVVLGRILVLLHLIAVELIVRNRE